VHHDAAWRRFDHGAVQPVPPSRVQLDAEEAERRADAQVVGEDVARDGPRVEHEHLRIGRAGEPGRAGQDRRPRPPRGVDGADEHPRDLREERAVLVGHEVADDAPADHLDLVADAEALLEPALALVEGGIRHAAERFACRDAQSREGIRPFFQDRARPRD
jgi:hypothetical protein